MNANDDCTDEVKILLSGKKVTFSAKQRVDTSHDEFYSDLVNQLRKKHLKEYNPYEVTLTRKRRVYGATIVQAKVVFSRLGYINTKSERFDSEVYTECQWYDDTLFETILYLNADEAKINKIKALPIELKLNLVYDNLKNFNYDPKVNWNPQIYIENAIGELKQDIRYSVEAVKKSANLMNKYYKHDNSYTIQVKEIRFIKGCFYEVRFKALK